MEQPAVHERSRLGPLLIASFALTVLSFLIATVVAELRARGIEAAASSIATNAMPSIQHLADERTDLRLMESLLIEYAHRVTVGQDASALVPQIRRAREQMARQWVLEESTPLYLGEGDLWTEIKAATEAVDAAVERVLAVTAGDGGSLENMIFSDLRPSVDRLSRALLVDIQYNAVNGERLAAEIEASRAQQQRLSALLIGTSVVFAAIACLAVARVLRGYTAMMGTRIAELERFNGRVAHDIRSPLTAVVFAIESTRRRCALDEIGRATLDRASRAVQRVTQVVEAMLVLARAGMPPEKGARADVRAMAQDGIEELTPDARAKGVELGLEPGDPIEVACAPGVLMSILSNLIGNAIKYIGDGPSKRVRVGVRARGARVHIDIVDTGPGVPARLRERIFDPYVRATSSSIPGLGLGLATVRRLVEAHDGTVGVEPGPGGGSRFWVELPLAPPAR